jgi:hypothetical protein
MEPGSGNLQLSGETVTRRTLLGLPSALALWSRGFLAAARAQPTAPPVNLLSAPLELGGDWGGSPPSAAAVVIARMREVCLSGLRLLSDQQPDKLRVDNHTSGNPAVWLHDEEPTTAWVIVDIGPRDWSKLTYQFGHELGHVLCNSWRRSAAPKPPSQWLEEAMVEAFSIRGLGRLAASWEHNPPFAGDAAFGAAIRQYRQNLSEKYQGAADQGAGGDTGTWFQKSRGLLESGGSAPEGPAILAVLAELERDQACVEDLGAVNRWPLRTGVPIEQYLALWTASCAEIHAPGHLPARLKTVFQIS